MARPKDCRVALFDSNDNFLAFQSPEPNESMQNFQTRMDELPQQKFYSEDCANFLAARLNVAMELIVAYLLERGDAVTVEDARQLVPHVIEVGLMKTNEGNN